MIEDPPAAFARSNNGIVLHGRDTRHILYKEEAAIVTPLRAPDFMWGVGHCFTGMKCTVSPAFSGNNHQIIFIHEKMIPP